MSMAWLVPQPGQCTSSQGRPGDDRAPDRWRPSRGIGGPGRKRRIPPLDHGHRIVARGLLVGVGAHPGGEFSASGRVVFGHQDEGMPARQGVKPGAVTKTKGARSHATRALMATDWRQIGDRLT